MEASVSQEISYSIRVAYVYSDYSTWSFRKVANLGVMASGWKLHGKDGALGRSVMVSYSL